MESVATRNIEHSTLNGLALKPEMKIFSCYMLQFVGFMVDKVAILQVLLRDFWLFPISIISFYH
jgi:hypothetical protein